MKRFEEILMFVYRIILHEVLVFLYDLADEGFHGFEEVLAG
jgi:hypothetical protein